MTVALSIGVALALILLSVMKATILRPTPYSEPDRLVSIVASLDESCGEHCPDLFPWSTMQVLQSMPLGTSAIAPVLTASLKADFRDSSVVLSATASTSAFFTVFGTRPRLGRYLESDDDAPDAPPVVVLSYGVWKRLFDGASDVVGRQLRLDGRHHAIIGVMPAGFGYPAGTEVWVGLHPAQRHGVGSAAALTAVGRLAASGTLDQLRARLQAVARLDRSHDARQGLAAASVTAQDRTAYGDLVSLLGAVAGAVLLLACLNVQILVLVRTIGRGEELGIRAAVGATRRRLVRDSMLEQVLVGIPAGLLAAGLTGLGLGVVDRVLRARFGLVEPIEFHASSLLVAVLAGVAASLAAGVPPLLAIGSGSPAAALLRRTSHHATAGRGQHGLRLALVAAQMAVALLLLSGSGVLLESFRFLRQVDLGFDASVPTSQIWIDDRERWDAGRVSDLARRATSHARAVPGVRRATAWSTMAPNMMVKPGDPLVTIEGSAIDTRLTCGSYERCPWPAAYQGVDSAFFDVLRVRLLAGRGFRSDDRRGSAPVAVVNRRAAELWWPTEDPIGKRFRIGSPVAGTPWLTVVGVAEDSHPVNESGLDWGGRFEDRRFASIYVPLDQMPLPGPGRPIWAADLLFGVALDPEAGISLTDVRRTVADAIPEVRMGPMSSFRSLLGTSWAIERMRSRFFALAFITVPALGLVLLGLVAVVTYVVSTRTREIVVRIALGAPRRSLLWLVSQDALVAGATGLAVGMALLVALTPTWNTLFLGAHGRFPGFVYGAKLLDPAVIAGAAGVSAALVLAASWIPAIKAWGLSAAQALKAD